MRLTLRTLLAYLDDVLEPSQTRELGEKINESGFAANLMAKIKDVMRRRRLSAPALSGPGAGIDCNLVGEYLDSTLAPDKVADVEKICLESDVHLAEVAACHQVLTLVLHEPVDISPEAKARLYALTPDGGAARTAPPPAEAPPPVLDRPSKVTGVKVLDAPPADIAFASVEHAPAAAQPAAPAASAAVPAYLREPERDTRWIKYIVALSIAFVWGVLMVKYGPFGGQENKTTPTPPVKVTQNDEKSVDVGDKGDVDQDPEVVPDRKVAVVDKKPAVVVPDVKPEPEVKRPVPAQEKISVPGKESPKAVVGTDADKNTDADKKNDTEKKKGPDQVAVRETDPKAPPKVVTPPADPKTTTPSKKMEVEVASKSPEKNTPAVTPTVTPTPPAQPDNLPPAAAIYKSNDSVLLHYDKKPDGWFVLGPQAHIHPDDRLAVPEPFEAQIRVDDGVLNVSLRGETRVKMLPPTPTVNHGWEVHRGRMLIRRGTEGDQPASLLLKVRQFVWRLDLLSPETQCAVQVDPVLTDRFEQELGDRSANAVLYVASGVVRLTRASPAATAEPLEIAGPASQPLTENPPAELMRGISHWVGPYNPTPALKNYMVIFAKKFEADGKVELSLTGEDPKAKIALLETQCLGLIDAYEPLVTILQRTPYDEVRRAAIDALRVWLPQQPGNRKLLKLALGERFTPDDAVIIYELLWGYTADDLRNRVKSNNLLDWMETGHIAIRELAFQQVFRLTKKQFDYRPNSSEAQIKASIKRWRREMQRDGALLPPLPAP